jgi:hypothetical protein
MKFNLFLSCNNDAFGENTEHDISAECRAETARILRETADRVEMGDIEGLYRTLWDINGNDVGRAAFKHDDYR